MVGDLQQVLFDFSRHPAAEDEGLLHPGGSEELQRVVDHGNVPQRQQSLLADARSQYNHIPMGQTRITASRHRNNKYSGPSKAVAHLFARI